MNETIMRIESSLARIDQCIDQIAKTDGDDLILELLCRMNDDLKRARVLIYAQHGVVVKT